MGSKITRDELRIAMGITGGGVLATGGFTLTVTSSGTAALLGTANVFSATNSITVNGAVSTAALLLSGALNVAGDGTTNFPNFFIQPTGATAATGWDTDGTAIGINLNLSAGTLIDMRVDGTQLNVFRGDGSCLLAQGVFQVVAASDLVTINAVGKINWNAQTYIGQKTSATATLQMGQDAAGVTNQMFTAASRITSDGVGANLTIAGGNGRGGAGGSLILSTYDTGAAATIGTLRSRMTFDTAGAVSFPVVTAVTTETVVSDTTWPITINGVAYKICLKA